VSHAVALIQRMPDAFDPKAAPGLDATVQYRISQPVYARIANNQCTVHNGEAESPDVTLDISDDDLIALLAGQLNGTTAFMTGRLRIQGDLMLVQKLLGLFDKSAFRD